MNDALLPQQQQQQQQQQPLQQQQEQELAQAARQERLQQYYDAQEFNRVPLFNSEETQAFVSFLEELVVDNQIMFNPRIPPSVEGMMQLTTHKREEAEFERMRRAPLAFDTDPLFASDGYHGTHKFVPVGYGHTHPASTAQKTPRSSDVSRSTSRSQSVVRPNDSAMQIQHGAADFATYPGYDTSMAQAQGSLGPFSLAPDPPPLWPQHQMNGSHLVQDQNNIVIVPHQHRKSFSMPIKPTTALPHHLQEPRSHDYGEPGPSSAKRSRSTSQSTAKRPAFSAMETMQSSAAVAAAAATKKTLTAAQKRQNHITSEQKRRNLIKEGFDTLSQLLPTLRGHGESKHFILTEAVAYVQKLQKRRVALQELLEELKRKE
jgi:hypothetical protein